jgi:hypothetical protein
MIQTAAIAGVPEERWKVRRAPATRARGSMVAVAAR